jgi:superfamily I DNA/RNA helicase
MAVTDEQHNIIHADGRRIVVRAFAGTGKTFTLVERAKQHAIATLYMAFNKSIATEAQGRFPRHVQCKTSHSLAYRAIGHLFSHKLGNLKPYMVAKALDLRVANSHKMALAQMALSAVRSFCASADMDIDDQHIDMRELSRIGLMPEDVRQAALQLWTRMCDVNDALVQEHDGYLKAWQLVGPRLDKQFDCIAVDESQDLNPVTLAILEQQDTQQIFVGDAHQSIYQFRGSLDALDRVKADQEYYLSASWRFGPNIAHTANRILSTFKGERVPLKGLGAEDFVGPCSASHKAYIHRTNAGIFNSAVDLLAQNPNAKLYFAGGIQGYNLFQILDTFNLKHGERDRIKDPYIGSFNDFDELQAFAENFDDKELKSRIRVIERHHSKIPGLVFAIQRQATENIEESDAVLGTVHKVKGLEFDHVVLGDDFPAMVEQGKPLTRDNIDRYRLDKDPLEDEEANLIYVAATRAIRSLDASNSSLGAFLATKPRDVADRLGASARM